MSEEHKINRMNGIICEEWRLNGLLHRVDGPAEIYYRENGKIWWKNWYLKGKRHRIDGPARISYIDDIVCDKTWYINGEEIKGKINPIRLKKLVDEYKLLIIFE